MAETWAINYEPKEGGRLTGHLTVDDEKLEFVALYDSSNAAGIKLIAGIVGGIVASGGHLAYIHGNDADMKLILPKKDVASTTMKKKMLAKRVIVTMVGGEDFVFNYGMLSVDKLAAAIQS